MSSKTEKKVELVELTTSKGNIYQVPSEYKDLSISQIIRNLTKDGWSKWEIHKVTGIRYQHVRNVLISPLKKK